MYTCLAERSSGPSSICSGLPSDNTYQSIGFVLHLSLVAWLRLIYIYIDDYTMHLLTLVFSFPCSIHRRDWPLVMAELQMVTLERRIRRATVTFRDDLYADDLLTSFMEHAGRWRHVLAEMHHRTFGYRRNDTQPESWDDDCDIAAAFLDHRRIWLGVMAELQRYPVTPSHDHMSPLQCRHRRTLAPLRLRCNIRRHMTSRPVRRNLLRAFNLAA